MQCPYCLSAVVEEALVCKTCTKDLYLFKPMMEKVALLEAKLEEIPNHEAYEKKILELEELIDALETKKNKSRGFDNFIFDCLFFIFLPLGLLLVSHTLITVVYDIKMLYLRIISIILPLPFGYFLFNSYKRSVFLWFIGVIFLAVLSVIGMSYITNLVDNSPIFPQSPLEWQEFFEYSVSIALSFLTGMLFGSFSYAAKQKYFKSAPINPYLKIFFNIVGDGKMSSEKLHQKMTNLQLFFGTVVALGTTGLSIYTGLKSIFGN
jgi:ABC-type multidrug transport system fused ATPase/permease subunit